MRPTHRPSILPLLLLTALAGCSGYASGDWPVLGDPVTTTPAPAIDRVSLPEPRGPAPVLAPMTVAALDEAIDALGAEVHSLQAIYGAVPVEDRLTRELSLTRIRQALDRVPTLEAQARRLGAAGPGERLRVLDTGTRRWLARERSGLN